MSTPAPEKHQGPENEIRVSFKTNVIKAVSRIDEVFKTFDHIIISGINSGISKVLIITEIAKLKYPGIHQYNLVETITMEMKEENKDDKEEKDTTENQRYSTRFKVELYKEKPKTAPKGFYQETYTTEQAKELSEIKTPEGEERRPRGAFRGRATRGARGRGSFHQGERGSDRGRGGRGRGRGGNRGDRRGGRGGNRGSDRGRGRGGADSRPRPAPVSDNAPRGKPSIPGLGKGTKMGN